MASLSAISPKFTKETLLEIVHKIKPGGSVTSWEVDNCSTRGSSYLSEVSRLNITGNRGEEQFLVKSFVKALPKNLARRQTFRSAEFFLREIEFYDKIWTGFLDFQNRHSIPAPYKEVPRYVGIISSLGSI